jgi:uncharacterized NAD(P)/FAD-binding protein YdhS
MDDLHEPVAVAPRVLGRVARGDFRLLRAVPFVVVLIVVDAV